MPSQEVQSVFLTYVLPVPGSSTSGCRQVSEGTAQQASLPRSYHGFTFSPSFLTHLLFFLINSGFKAAPFYLHPMFTQLAPAQEESPVISKGVIAHTRRPCSEWDLQDKILCHILKWMLEKTTLWAAVSMLTGPLFDQLVISSTRRKRRERWESYDGEPKQEDIWRELCLYTASRVPSSPWDPPWDRAVVAEGYL